MLCASGALIMGCDQMEPRSADASNVEVVHADNAAPPNAEPTDYDEILKKLRKPEVARPQDVGMGRAFGGRGAPGGHGLASEPPLSCEAIAEIEREVERRTREAAERVPKEAPAEVHAFHAVNRTVGSYLELYRVMNKGAQPPFATEGWHVIVGPDYMERVPVNHLTPSRKHASRLVPSSVTIDRTVAWVYYPDEYRIRGALPNEVAVRWGLVPNDHKPGDPHEDFVTY